MRLLNGLAWRTAGVNRQDARVLMTSYNKAVARDPMVARGEFLKGIGVPPAKGT